VNTTTNNLSPAPDNIPEIIPETTKRVNLSQAIDLRYKHNLSYRAIAEKLGVSHVAVKQSLDKVKKIIGDPEENNAYDKNRSHFLNGIERQLLAQLLNKDKTKKATLGNVAYAVDKVNNILRLERGQSTLNQAVKINVVRFSELSEVEGNENNRARIEVKTG
jgi:predicted DNA-binding protein YlxM (UPF0122 family)